jgi:hypothetical protein
MERVQTFRSASREPSTMIIQSSDQHYRRLMMGFGAAAEAELLASGLDSDR